MNLNRRDFGKLALATAAAPTLLSAKPDSLYGGVQIGVITYSFRDMPNAHTDAMAMLKYITDSNASGIEFMNDAAEAFAGSPAVAYAAQGGGGRGMGMGRGGRGASGAPQLTPEQMAQQQAAREEMMKQQQARAEELKKWRLSVSMDKYKELRKLYNDAGVTIYAFKLEPLPPNVSDEELDYIFTVGATLGATHVTTELPNGGANAMSQRWGDTAVKHNMRVAYHAHEQATITAWDTVLAQSKGNAVNLDCGHYFAGTGESPVPAIEKLHDRIASIHLKDRGTGGRAASNLPWGQAQTPITEILQTVKKNGYKFPASVELEYQVPPGSDSVVEVKKCIEYARKSLA
jgi:sugar phosphate isomerase/epimerase